MPRTVKQRPTATVPLLALSVIVLLVTGGRVTNALEEWEVPLVWDFLVCDGPLSPGCEAFSNSDFETAASSFRALADRGDSGAWNNLGVLFESGAGVAQSKAEALRWYRRGADAGLPMAQHNLGVLVAADHVLGTVEDPSTRSADFIEAYVLFGLAESQGLDLAAQGRMDLARHMNRDEITAAEKQLKDRLSASESN